MKALKGGHERLRSDEEEMVGNRGAEDGRSIVEWHISVGVKITRNDHRRVGHGKTGNG